MKPMLGATLGLLLAAGAVQADVIHLKNGRIVEGEILEHTTQRVAVKLPGGKIVFPTDQVHRIELRRTAKQEYGERVRATDMEDPEALDALALWASGRGLGDEATALQNMAMGLRLEARIEEVRGSRRVGDFIELFHWARGQNCSDEVLEWLLAQAEGIDAQDYEVQDARRLRTEDVQGRAQLAARRAELRNRPRYRMPDLDRQTNGGVPAAQLETARSGEGQADDRIAQLEQELEEQRKRIAQLEEETAKKNRPIYRRRRAGRGSNGAITATPDVSVQLLPVPPVVIPPAGGAAPPPPPPPAPRPYTPPSPYVPQVVPPPPVQYPR